MTAIRADGLGKRYHIGELRGHGLLKDHLSRLFSRSTDSGDAARNPAGDDGTIWALKDVTFEVARGESVGIVGRNGAGKSTLMKILARVTAPTEGRAEIHGQVVPLLAVGAGFHPELTGRENIYLSGGIHGLSRSRVDTMIDDVLAFAEIGQFVDTPLKFYSQGMGARLGFAMAVSLAAEVLLIDEVLSVGDHAFREKCFDTIDKLRNSGQSILLVSHNSSIVRRLTDRCVYLKEGRIQEIGPTDKVLSRYHGDTIGDGGSMESAVPKVFLSKIPDPVASIANIEYRGIEGDPEGQATSGAPAILRFDVCARENLDNLDVAVLVFSDGERIRADHSQQYLGQMNLEAGESRRIEVSYAAFPLAAGDYAAVVFARRKESTSAENAVSDYAIVPISVRRHDADLGSGRVGLAQSWRAVDGRKAAGC